MDTKIENPPAIPCKEVHYGDYEKGTDDTYTFHTGMTLRDYFAGQAVTRLMSADGVVPDVGRMAEYAYRIADAMLKARGGGDE